MRAGADWWRIVRRVVDICKGVTSSPSHLFKLHSRAPFSPASASSDLCKKVQPAAAPQSSLSVVNKIEKLAKLLELLAGERERGPGLHKLCTDIET